MLSSTTVSIDEHDLLMGLFDWRNLNQFLKLIQEIQSDLVLSKSEYQDKSLHILLNSNLLQGLTDSYGRRGVEFYDMFSGDSLLMNCIHKHLSLNNGLIPFEAMSEILGLESDPSFYLLPLLKNDSMVFESLYFKSLRHELSHDSHDSYLSKQRGFSSVDRYRYFSSMKDSINFKEIQSEDELDIVFRPFTLLIMPSSRRMLSHHTNMQKMNSSDETGQGFLLSELSPSSSYEEDSEKVIKILAQHN